MSTKLKLLPALIMLIAGAASSIITFVLHYDTVVRLWIIIGVLIVFYILGLVIQKIIKKFDDQIAEEEAKKAEEEGKVVEKGLAEGEAAEGGTNENRSVSQESSKEGNPEKAE